MSHEKLYEEATKVAATASEPGLDGLETVDLKDASDATEQTAYNFFAGALDAHDQRLSRETAELSLAFYGMAFLMSRCMTAGLSLNAHTLSDEYERLAKEAGEQLGTLNGEPPRPNIYLKLLAAMIRQVGKPAAAGAIDGDEASVDPRPATGFLDLDPSTLAGE